MGVIQQATHTRFVRRKFEFDTRKIHFWEGTKNFKCTND